jgi:hypothetical protein
MGRLGRLEARVGGVEFLRRDHFLIEKRFHPLEIDLSLVKFGLRLDHSRSLIHIKLRRGHGLQPQPGERQRQVPFRLLHRMAKLCVFNARQGLPGVDPVTEIGGDIGDLAVNLGAHGHLVVGLQRADQLDGSLDLLGPHRHYGNGERRALRGFRRFGG